MAASNVCDDIGAFIVKGEWKLENPNQKYHELLALCFNCKKPFKPKHSLFFCDDCSGIYLDFDCTIYRSLKKNE